MKTQKIVGGFLQVSCNFPAKFLGMVHLVVDENQANFYMVFHSPRNYIEYHQNISNRVLLLCSCHVFCNCFMGWCCFAQVVGGQPPKNTRRKTPGTDAETLEIHWVLNTSLQSSKYQTRDLFKCIPYFTWDAMYWNDV